MKIAKNKWKVKFFTIRLLKFYYSNNSRFNIFMGVKGVKLKELSNHIIKFKKVH